MTFDEFGRDGANPAGRSISRVGWRAGQGKDYEKGNERIFHGEIPVRSGGFGEGMIRTLSM